jgi:hypothetical protein
MGPGVWGLHTMRRGRGTPARGSARSVEASRFPWHCRTGTALLQYGTGGLLGRERAGDEGSFEADAVQAKKGICGAAEEVFVVQRRKYLWCSGGGICGAAEEVRSCKVGVVVTVGSRPRRVEPSGSWPSTTALKPSGATRNLPTQARLHKPPRQGPGKVRVRPVKV